MDNKIVVEMRIIVRTRINFKTDIMSLRPPPYSMVSSVFSLKTPGFKESILLLSRPRLVRLARLARLPSWEMLLPPSWRVLNSPSSKTPLGTSCSWLSLRKSSCKQENRNYLCEHCDKQGTSIMSICTFMWL